MYVCMYVCMYVFLMPLYKSKGKRSDCDNHRGITLLVSVGKVLAWVLLNRLQEEICPVVVSESPCGFRSGRRCVDMIFSRYKRNVLSNKYSCFRSLLTWQKRLTQSIGILCGWCMVSLVVCRHLCTCLGNCTGIWKLGLHSMDGSQTKYQLTMA